MPDPVGAGPGGAADLLHLPAATLSHLMAMADLSLGNPLRAGPTI